MEVLYAQQSGGEKNFNETILISCNKRKFIRT